jgi:nicotinate-nucleotide pyrophosphorylase (carboxylating)
MREPYEYLSEDLDTGKDVTSEAVIGDEKVTAVIIANEDCTIAGLEEAVRIFEHEGLTLIPGVSDGSEVKKGTHAAQVTGNAKSILLVERLALNFITRMSGIATETKELVDKCRKINPEVKISATRKTTPGFRKYEKKAVVLGGGVSHRTGLHDMILIKDNHLKITGSITESIQKAKASGLSEKVEVEVIDMGGAIEAARAGPDIIMLDNMEPFEVEGIAAEIRKINPNIEVEVSGGINPGNIEQYARHADVISLGWLTHSSKACNFSLEIIEVF